MSDDSHIDLNNETDCKTVLEKIATLIKRIPNRGMLTQPMLAAMMLNNYLERTEEHIKLVKNCGLKLIPFIEEKGISGALFEQELSAHDHDKLDNFDIVPIYAAYTQFVYNNGKYKDLCRLEDGVEKEFNEVAWPKHYKLNSHHVGEYFGKLVDGCYVVESDKHFIEIAHMVADWMAMGRAMNNSATVWWSKCKRENKYSFKDEDVAWLEKLLLVETATKQVPTDSGIEDIVPMDAIMLSNDTSGITDSMERFYVNDKSLEQELLAIPRLDAKTLLATLKPGDLIVTYPKVNTFSDKISYTLNSFVQRMAFSSIKLVGTNNDVVGYGVTGKLMLQSAKIEQLPTLFSGITVLRHKQLNTTTVKKIYSWVYDKLTKDIPYDKFGILKAIVERLFKIPGVQLTADTIDNSVSALYCSTILQLAFKKFGLDTGISIIGDFNIFPKDFLYSKRFNKVGMYLDDGEDASTEDSRINKITKIARAQYDADGPNQWPHISRVLREGYIYCKLLKIEMSDTIYAAILFHDCAKGDSKKDHGKESSKKAKSLLEPFFTKQELSEILVAIAEHNNNKPGTSQTSELLKAADANILDIAWFLSKLYWKRKNKGMSEGVIYKDCLETIQKGYLTFDHEGAYRPKYWAMRYEKELPKVQQTISVLTEDTVKKMIKSQLAKTNNAPSYESIGHTGENSLTRNDNYDIMKNMLSSVSEYKYGLYYKGAGLVTDQKRFHEFDPKDLLLQSPEMFVKNKGGMCHDATLYVDTLLTKKKLNHKNIYVESWKEPYRPTHSFVVVEADKGKWYVVDVFSIQHCVYKDEFKTWQDAAKFRLVKWLEEEHLEKYPVKALMIQKFPPPNSNIELFMQYMNKYGIVYNVNRPISKEDLMISANSTTIKEIVESNKPENTISIGLENLDISTEAAGVISTKKKAILDYICKYCDIMDPSKLNSTRYRKMISGMTDKQFDTFMHDMRDGKFQLHIVAPNMKVNLKIKDMIAAADALKLKLFHRIWMRDNATGRKFLSDNEYLVVKLPVRRQEQFIDKKMSVPDNDRSIDGLTGQVSWDSKACAITNPEIQILAARNMDATLFELVNVRGGNINSYAELKRSLEENGEARLNDLDPTARSRVAVMGGVLLTAMLIDSNL